MDIIIIIITFIITLGAQAYINSTYKKLNKVEVASSLTGSEVARKILDKNGLSNVKVNPVGGILSDHYDPRSKVVNLSSEVFSGNSIASCAVAAHEVGHAIQDKNNYFFLKFRNSIVPIVNFASFAGYIAIVIGMFMASFGFIWLGIIMELIILLFQVVTLPVEFNASNRALKQLEELNIVSFSEKKKTKKMLVAAALTYVASVATAVLEILRLVLMVRRDD